MPELPEVEFARKCAIRIAKNKVIREVRCAPDKIVLPEDGAHRASTILPGRRVVDVQRKGKYFWFQMDQGPAVVFHLGMTGTIRIPNEGALSLETGAAKKDTSWPPQFTKIHFLFDDHSEMVMTNARRFGRVFLRDNVEREDPIAKLGFDPLLHMPSQEIFLSLMRKRKGVIKALLLNQAFAAGVGNWIADEVLFQAHIDPRRRVPSLSDEEIHAIQDSLSHVIQQAVQVDAHKERFPKDWLFHQRWGKGKDRKTVAGHPILFMEVGGRTTAWVPAIQK